MKVPALTIWQPWASLIIAGEWVREAIAKARGKNVACWCGLDQACHADVVCELANAPRQGAT